MDVEDRSFVLELLIVTEDDMSREDAEKLGERLSASLLKRKGVENALFTSIRGADD